MYSIDSGLWQRKPGADYVKKFQQLEASARHWNDTDHDSDESDKVVTFGDEFSSSTVTFADDGTEALIKQESIWAESGEFGGSNLETEFKQQTHFKQINETTLKVDERSAAEEIKRFNWDESPVTDPLQGRGSDSRSFLVDIPTGNFLTHEADLSSWFTS